MAYINLARKPILVLLRRLPSNTLDVVIRPCNSRAVMNYRNTQIAVGHQRLPGVAFKKLYVIYKLPRMLNISGPLPKSMESFASTLSSVFNPPPEMPRWLGMVRYHGMRSCRVVNVKLDPRTINFTPGINVIRVRQRTTQRLTRGASPRQLRVNRNEVVKLVKEMRHTRGKVLHQIVNFLRPGKTCKVHIVLASPGNRTEAVQTLLVHTDEIEQS